MYGWNDWKKGALDLTVVVDPDSHRGVLFSPEIDRSDCTESCLACPQAVSQWFSDGVQVGQTLEVKRQCDGMVHRLIYLESHCALAGQKCMVLRSRTLDKAWNKLTQRERELVTATREHGWDQLPAALGISPKTAWAHRRSICSKANLISIDSWHRFVIHNG